MLLSRSSWILVARGYNQKRNNNNNNNNVLWLNVSLRANIFHNSAHRVSVFVLLSTFHTLNGVEWKRRSRDNVILCVTVCMCAYGHIHTVFTKHYVWVFASNFFSLLFNLALGQSQFFHHFAFLLERFWTAFGTVLNAQISLAFSWFAINLKFYMWICFDFVYCLLVHSVISVHRPCYCLHFYQPCISCAILTFIQHSDGCYVGRSSYNALHFRVALAFKISFSSCSNWMEWD